MWCQSWLSCRRYETEHEAAVAYDIAAVLFRGAVSNRHLNTTVQCAISEAYRFMHEPWVASTFAKFGTCAQTHEAQALLAATRPLNPPPLDADMPQHQLFAIPLDGASQQAAAAAPCANVMQKHASLVAVPVAAAMPLQRRLRARQWEQPSQEATALSSLQWQLAQAAPVQFQGLACSGPYQGAADPAVVAAAAAMAKAAAVAATATATWGGGSSSSSDGSSPLPSTRDISSGGGSSGCAISAGHSGSIGSVGGTEGGALGLLAPEPCAGSIGCSGWGQTGEPGVAKTAEPHLPDIDVDDLEMDDLNWLLACPGPDALLACVADGGGSGSGGSGSGSGSGGGALHYCNAGASGGAAPAVQLQGPSCSSHDLNIGDLEWMMHVPGL